MKLLFYSMSKLFIPSFQGYWFNFVHRINFSTFNGGHMTLNLKKFILQICVYAAVFITSETEAYDKGDFIVRMRAIDVMPSSDSGEIHTSKLGVLQDTNLWAQNSATLELDFSYMITRNIGLELILATTKHDIVANSTLEGILNNHKKVGTTWVLPPTLSLQYHLCSNSQIQPYAGIGVNYSIFYNEKSRARPEYKSLKLSNSWGYSLEAGTDIFVDCNWFINLDVKYISMRTHATLSHGTFGNGDVGSAKAHVKINPWVFGIGFGRKF